MNKDFPKTNNQENILKKTDILESNKKLYAKIKSNILELFLENNNLYSENKIKRKNHSEQNSKYRKKNIQKILHLKDIKGTSPKKNKKDIKKKENLYDSGELDLNIKEDEKPFNLNDFEQELKEKEINNKNKLNNKINNSNENQRFSRDSKDIIEKIINSTGCLLNNNDKSSNNDCMNNNNRYSLNDISSNNNSNQNINILNYYSNSNTNKSNTNYAFNFFGVNNNQEDNSSLNSSKNELSSKNVKLNNNNNRISNLSSSSFSKNFVLKSEVCKSTFHNENRNRKNTYSEDNPIMTYFGKDINNKNFGNFYLFTDRKSTEEIEQNQYINFFPLNDNTKKTCKDIMSCNYMDSNTEISEKINAEIITENYENNNEYNFNLNELHGETSNDKKHNFEFIKKNFMKGKKNTTVNNNNNNNIKSNIEIIFEYDDLNNINKIIDAEKDSLDKNENDKINDINNNIKDNIPNENINNNNSSNENNNKPNNKFDISLNNNNKENNIINPITINNNEDMAKKQQMPLSFINNIYNINNSNFKQYQINPIVNTGMPNYFYTQNINSNPIMNYYNPNFQTMNYFRQFYNQKNNQFQNDYFKSLNNQINNNTTNSNNNINNNKINPNLSNSINNNDKSINNNTNNSNTNKNIFNYNINNNIKTNNMNNNFYNNNITTLLPNKNFYEYSEEEILNSAMALIKDQYGCRFMQEKIKENHHFANEILFPKIKYNLKELSCDSFGNYFLQAMIDILSFDNINKFFDMTQNEFTEICISPHGTRVIQKIIDKISSTPILMNRFIYNLNSKDLGVIFKSPYGNHMIQKFLTTTHISEYSNFIFNFIYKNFLDIANSKHGVCVIQKCVSEGDEKQRSKLYELILGNFNILMKDSFGNYLIQYMLINTKTEEKFKEILPIISKIEENMIDLCKSKFSANVIEKCFENSDNIIREHILNYLLENYSEYIIDILLDQYGIYVIQKALKLKNSIYRNKLIQIIYSKEKELKNIDFSDYKYKNILKTINSHKELGDIFSKIIKINNNKNNIEKNQYENNNENNYNNKGEDNRNDYYNYNRGKNKRGRKYYRGNNNRF